MPESFTTFCGSSDKSQHASVMAAVMGMLTGIGGECWTQAAAAVAAAYGLAVDVVSIGPAGCDAQDIYADWYRQSEVDEDGCVVVRPDMYVAWRSRQAVANASDVLVGVFGQLLGRSAETGHSKASVAAA